MFRRLLSRHPLAIAALGLASLAFVFFGWQFVAGSQRMVRPDDAPQPLARWMSPAYVGHLHGLPREDVMRLLEIDARAPARDLPRTLGEVIARTGLSLDVLQARVDAASDPRHRNDKDAPPARGRR